MCDVEVRVTAVTSDETLAMIHDSGITADEHYNNRNTCRIDLVANIYWSLIHIYVFNTAETINIMDVSTILYNSSI